jgi:hypothetical protein
MLFAEELPTSVIVPQNAVTIVIVLSVCLFLLNFAAAILVFVMAAKRKPSVEAEFATKAELHREIAGVKATIQISDDRIDKKFDSLDERNDERSKEVFRKIDDIAKSFDLGMREVHRVLGRLEGGPK